MSVLSYAIACPFMPNASWDAKPDILTLQYGMGDLFICDNGSSGLKFPFEIQIFGAKKVA